MNKTIKVSKVLDGIEVEKKQYQKTIFRWPWWVRIKIYKKIAILMLTDEIGFNRAATLSTQKIIDLAVAKKLGIEVVEKQEEPVSGDDISAFMATMDKRLHRLAINAVHEEKMNGNLKASLNTWAMEAVKEYLEEI